MNIQLIIDPLINQLECLSRQVGAPVVDNRLHYPPAIGKGYVQGYFFPNDLSLYEYQTEQLWPLGFQTINPARSGLYCLFITLSAQGLEKTVGEETHQLGRYSPDSIFYYAPDNHIFQQFTKAGPLLFLVITFTRHTLEGLLSEATLEKVLPKQGCFLFLDLDLKLEKLAGLIIQPDKDPFSRLNRYGQTLSLLVLVLEKVLTRQTTKGTDGILQPDIERLFLVRRHLLEHLTQTVGVKELAHLAGFSETKLKRLFPRLFGTSMHHYQQKARMEKAAELLSSRRYSVSEAGYLVGYINLTHFAQAFFRHHGLKPSQYLQAVKTGQGLPSGLQVLPLRGSRVL